MEVWIFTLVDEDKDITTLVDQTEKGAFQKGLELALKTRSYSSPEFEVNVKGLDFVNGNVDDWMDDLQCRLVPVYATVKLERHQL